MSYFIRIVVNFLLFHREVSLELGRFQVTEGLFHPEAWGLDNPGIQKLVHKAIQVSKPLTNQQSKPEIQ